MRPLTIAAAGAVALAAALPAAGLVLADDTTPASPPAPASTSTVELPLLGVPLGVTITTDAGGGLVGVELGTPDGFVATQLRPGKVTFSNEADGTKVRVSGSHGRQRIEARAGTLADISGPGSWSGDVFETGDTTSVTFTVTEAASGGPDIVGLSVTPAPADVEFVVGETSYESETDDDGELEQSASVKVELSYLGQTRTLKITAETESGDDDGPSAKLKISLSKLHGRQLQTADADGVYRWSGQLCSGEPATIEYTVEGGSVQVASTSPDAEVKAEGRQAKVAFGRHERVSIKVMGDDGETEVGVSKRFACDRVDPAVNTEIAPDDDDSSDDDSSSDDSSSDDSSSDDSSSDDDRSDEQRGRDRKGDHRGDDDQSDHGRDDD